MIASGTGRPRRCAGGRFFERIASPDNLQQYALNKDHPPRLPDAHAKACFESLSIQFRLGPSISLCERGNKDRVSYAAQWSLQRFAKVIKILPNLFLAKKTGRQAAESSSTCLLIASNKLEHVGFHQSRPGQYLAPFRPGPSRRGHQHQSSSRVR